MCGIAGIVRGDHSEPVDPDIVRRMCRAMVHRGPDDDGFHFDRRVWLWMRRLSIIDLTGGRQPIHNEDATIQVIFNGEIYNYLALKASLQADGHRFYTQSDTEVIVHAYEQYGRAFLQELRGMFALALWDARTELLFLAVDRMGIKPLYYLADDRGILFGSELRALLASGQVPRELDFEALAQYFTFGYIPAPRSIFRHVAKLLPGSCLTWTPSAGAKTQAYWDCVQDRICRDRKPAQTRQELRAVLKDAVRSHLISDVPLGAFLSGGIDSSIVVALMSEVVAEPVRTFSIGFADRHYNELGKARLVARRFRTDHHEFVVEPESVEVLAEIVAHFGEPFADSSALPTYFVSKLARQYVKVALSGDGGDELFLGYTIFRGLELARYAQHLPASVRRTTASFLRRLSSPRPFPGGERAAKWRKRLGDSLLSPREAYLSKLTMGGLENIGPLLSPDLSRQLAQCNAYAPVDHYLEQASAQAGAHPLAPYAHLGLKLSLPNDMLVKVDRMSMAHSLEVRVPLLDHVLAEFVATIPIGQRFSRWRLKGLLKDTMADVLPAPILKQTKQGFSIPMAAWFSGDLAGFFAEVLLSPEARRHGYWDARALERLLRGPHPTGYQMGTLLWSMVVFELWCQHIHRTALCEC